jgi:DNA (cytosine-5)-methyltransferase 1
MTAYYNEVDPKAAAWLRELIRQGVIAPGEVDSRSIEDVTPNDLKRFTQCHFFAGIGVWSYALRLAEWPDTRPVWTGSCPCQPFSAAGKGAGTSDKRHLWPSWYHLIEQCRPPSIFGEQVASKAADIWADLVQDDLEALGYAFGAVPFPAASVGAPHIRDRLYWVADDDARREQHAQRNGEPLSRGAHCAPGHDVGGCGKLGNHHHQGLEGWGLSAGGRAGERSPWAASDFVWCRDGKWRPVEPGSFPLAHGAPERVGRLRGYGNAIVAQAAKIFIEESGLL